MLKNSKDAQQDSDGWVLLGSPSRTNPPELPVPGTTRKASYKAKKGTHALIFFSTKAEGMLNFGIFTRIDFFKGKCGSWSASQVKQTWPISPSRSRVGSWRALDLGMLSSNLLGILNTSN